ncbi:response regulator transcription factor [Rhodanobacter sp. Col0626]|uniref:response regulator transcription factor n=1 Tax=Rhodanobacter sp. Col0626 TaxID=3415679 RepID=UPI003CEB1798
MSIANPAKDHTSSAPIDRAQRPLRVLLVEDDPEIRDEILVPGLRNYGIDVIGADCAATADRLLRENTFDIVVLDVGLPDESGFSVARRLRAGSSAGIVMLTGRTENPDRVRGLSEGADAYLTKPVALDVLVATLRSLGRRLSTSVPPPTWQLTADSWCLLSPRGVSMALTLPERRILGRLMAGDGEPVSRDELIAMLTEDILDFDPHRLEMFVYRLRCKVAESCGETLPLRAVRGVGYVLTC